MKYKLAVFDLDGTILNTLDDLADSLNHCLSLFEMPERTIDEVRRFVGNGIRKLIERAVPENSSDDVIDRVYGEFIKYYGEHCSDKTKAYDGIEKLIENLRKSGCHTAVVSNKADYAVQELCRKYFNGCFDYAVGEREGISRKPSPDSVNEVLEKLSISRKNAVYIGDSDVDIMTAANADMDCISVSWGFRDCEFLKKHGASLIVDSPDEIQKIILD